MNWLANFGLILQCLLAIIAIGAGLILLICHVHNHVTGYRSWRAECQSAKKEAHDLQLRLNRGTSTIASTKQEKHMTELKVFRFGKGKHNTREDGMCVMEAVAYLAGESHSNHPQCASPVITKLAIWLNDTAGDELRQELLLDLPWRLVGTRASDETEQRRAYMAADWVVRFVTPIAFRRVNLEKEAASLEHLSEVIDKESAGTAARTAAAAARTAEAVAAWAEADGGVDRDKILRSCAELIGRMAKLTEPQEVMRARQRELLGV